MRIRGLWTVLVLVTLLAWALLIATLIFFQPKNNGPYIIIVFYISLFFSLGGLFSLISFFIKKINHRKKISNNIFFVSLLQGFILSLILVIILLVKKI